MSNKLAVLGLDGLDWNTVNNSDEFDWFGSEIENDRMGPLFISTFPHTVPSWALAFTGMDIANELGIKAFKGIEPAEDGDPEPHWYTSEDIPKPFIWDLLEAQGYDVVRSNWLGLDHKFTGDFKYDCEYLDAKIEEQTDRTMFDSEPKEIEEVMYRQWGEMCNIASNKRPDALISYFHGPDLMGHVLKGSAKHPGGSWEELVDNYHSVEDLTKEMVEKLVGLGYDVLYLSDHGLPDGMTRHKGESICTHKAIGVVGSPTLDLEYPMKMSDIFPFMVDYFDLDTDVDVEASGHEMDDEEIEYVENQLKGLGYL